VLMIFSIPALALNKINFYRAIVWMTTILSVALILITVTNTSQTLVLTIAFLTAAWPVVVTRLIGRRAFFGEKTLQKLKKIIN